jgi:hypothetical protein
MHRKNLGTQHPTASELIESASKIISGERGFVVIIICSGLFARGRGYSIIDLPIVSYDGFFFLRGKTI